MYGACHYNPSNTAQNVSNSQKNFEFFFITFITKLMSKKFRGNVTQLEMSIKIKILVQFIYFSPESFYVTYISLQYGAWTIETTQTSKIMILS